MGSPVLPWARPCRSAGAHLVLPNTRRALTPRRGLQRTAAALPLVGWSEVELVVTDSHQIPKQLERGFQIILLQILDCFSPIPHSIMNGFSNLSLLLV